MTSWRVLLTSTAMEMSFTIRIFSAKGTLSLRPTSLHVRSKMTPSASSFSVHSVPRRCATCLVNVFGVARMSSWYPCAKSCTRYRYVSKSKSNRPRNSRSVPNGKLVSSIDAALLSAPLLLLLTMAAAAAEAEPEPPEAFGACCDSGGAGAAVIVRSGGAGGGWSWAPA